MGHDKIGTTSGWDEIGTTSGWGMMRLGQLVGGA